MLALVTTVIPIGFCFCLGARRLSLQHPIADGAWRKQGGIPPASSDYQALLLEVEWRGDRLR